MTEKDKMLKGMLYDSTDKELRAMSNQARVYLDAFNQTELSDFSKRAEIGQNLFGKIGNNLMINKPFYCDYGKNITIGDNFYANFDCIILDVCEVKIGNNVMFGPRVCVYAATHPLEPSKRLEGLEYGKPVTIGNNVWIGGNTVINPGVTIGDDTVIGSGSVVTKNIPSGVVAAGNPCKIIRKI